MEALAEYHSRRARRDSVVAAVERQFGKTFAKLSGDEYTRFMDRLDLTSDDDLWTWSHVTGITMVGLTQHSNFFYFNAHLLKDTQAAVRLTYAELSKFRSGYDEASGKPTLVTADGRKPVLREISAGTVRRSAHTGRFLHDEDFAESRTNLDALAPYLVTLDSISNREAIARALRALPLSIVKAYRGKAIYLTTQTGRSYAVGMPVSNSTYVGFVGMQPGVFLDRNRDSLTMHNLVHEIGHVIDYTAIQGQYGSYLHPYQFPEFRKLKIDKDRTFGKGDDRVPQTTEGYVSEYAKANAQENFAEHFAHFILHREAFLEMAARQQAAGERELMRKFRFLETLLERTPVTTVRLSSAYVMSLPEPEPTP